MEKGIIQIYYGEGRGKTSAALGNAIKFASMGKSVYMVQFMQNNVFGGDQEKVIEILSSASRGM